jgi:hypothetical protein
MRRLRATSLAALAGLLVLGIAAPVSAAAPMGKLRAFHDSPDTPAVDVYVNDSRVLTKVPYKGVSKYLEVPSGKTYTIGVKVWDADTNDASDPYALTKAVKVGTGATTVAAIGSLTELLDGTPAANDLRLKVYRDRVGVRGNWALVRVNHTSPDAPAVDVQVRISGSWLTVVRDLSFGESSVYLPLPQKNLHGNLVKYTFRVRVAGTTTVVKQFTTPLPYKALSVWAIGFLDPAAYGSSNGFRVPFVTKDGRN